MEDIKLFKDIKVGLVGCGNIARVHIKYIIKIIPIENIAICDLDPLRVEDFAVESTISNTFTDLDQMLKEFSPDVVHILTPPGSHSVIAQKCLEQNCHLFIEKPVSLASKDAKDIIQASEKYNRLICIDHMRLFDPLFKKAEKIINTGDFGDLIHVSAVYGYDFLERAQFDAGAKWMSLLPGGAFFDVIPHPLCIIDKYLPDMELQKSYTQGDKDGTITDVTCIFSSPHNIAGTLKLSYRIYPLQNFVLFEFRKGILKVDFRNFLITIRPKYGLPNAVERIAGSFSEGFQVIWGTLKAIYNFALGRLDSYMGMENLIIKFYHSINCNGKSPVSGEDALRLLKITEKIFPHHTMSTKDNLVSREEPVKCDVLVTGGTGFIGRKLVNRLLKEGKRVRILTHRKLTDEEKESYSSKDVSIVEGNIYNIKDVENVFKGVDTVYHMAAAMKGSWSYHLDTTITGTKNILLTAKKFNIKHLIYISTLNVYDAKNYPDGVLINESFPYEDKPEKRGAYSHAKLRAERIVMEFKKGDNLPITIFRPGLVYGPGIKPFFGDVGYRIGKKLVIVLGMGNRRLPLIFVDDLVELFYKACEPSEESFDTFNAVDRTYPSQKEFIEYFKKETDESFITFYIPESFINTGFWLVEKTIALLFKKAVFLRYKYNCVKYSPVHDIEKTERVFDWKPDVSFEDGLRKTLDSL